MATTAPAVPVGRAGRHPWLSVLWTAARTPRGTAGLAMAALVVLVALVGPAFAPHSPNALLTLTFAKPSAQFPLGGDELGRDVLSRVLYGGRLLLLMAVAARRSASCSAPRRASRPPTCAERRTGSSCAAWM
jgi:ABC-type dipeptide/oligopeptide/nickel transport systems, permease components